MSSSYGSILQRASEAHATLAGSRAAALQASKAVSKPAPAPFLAMAKPLSTAKADSPRDERKKIGVVAGDTVLGVHDRLQVKRYGSYGHALKTYAMVPIAGYFFLTGKYLIALPFLVMIGYFIARYREDHGKYLSWKKRPVVIPDMALYDKNPKLVRFEGLHTFLSPSALPTIVD